MLARIQPLATTSATFINCHSCRCGEVRKTARRDLPHVIAQGLTGATTVSATMALAARAGISIFVTGGEWAAPPTASTVQ